MGVFEAINWVDVVGWITGGVCASLVWHLPRVIRNFRKKDDDYTGIGTDL